jgi:hypothetical protein
MRRALLLALLAAAGCREERRATVAVASDAAPRVGEVAVPAPRAAVGDVQLVRSEIVATGTVRLYEGGKWRGNAGLVMTTEAEARVEVLAVDGGQPSRLRLEYSRYRATVKVGGDERDVAPRLEGRSFIADLAGGLSLVAGDGAVVGAGELGALRREVEWLSLWTPVQGRTLLLGQAVTGGPPWNGTFMLKDRRATSAIVAARLTLDEGVVDGEAVIDLATGWVTRFTADGTTRLVEGARRGMELVGDVRVRVVREARPEG